MFWVSRKYLLKHIVLEWHKLSYHLLRSVDLWFYVLMVRSESHLARPKLIDRLWPSIGPSRGPLSGGMSERLEWYSAPSHNPSLSLPLPSSLSLPPPRHFATSSSSSSSDVPLHVQCQVIGSRKTPKGKKKNNLLWNLCELKSDLLSIFHLARNTMWVLLTCL